MIMRLLMMWCLTLIIFDQGSAAEAKSDTTQIPWNQLLQQQTVSVDRYVSEIKKYFAESDYGEAQQVLARALEQYPSHPRLKQLQQRLFEVLPQPDMSLVDGEDLQKQIHLVTVRQKIALAELQAADGALDRAIALLIQVDELLSRYPDEAIQLDRDRLGQFITEMESQARREQQVTGRLERQELQEQAYQRRADVENKQISVFDLRLRRIHQRKQRGLYDLALADCRRLRDEFPQHDVVHQLYTELLDLVHTQRELDHEERMAEVLKEMDARLHRMMIPTGFDGQPDWPSTWWEIQHKREVNLEQETVREVWREDIENRLNQIVDIRFDGEDALTALDYITQISGLPIVG